MEEDAFIIQLKGGVPDFSNEDINSVLSLKNGFNVRSISGNIYVSDCNEKSIADLSFMKRFGKIIGEYHLLEDIQNVQLPPGKFYIRVIDELGCHGTEHEKSIGDLVGAKGRVSFKNPDFVLLAFHADKWYIALEGVKENARTDERRAPMRPYFTPISMDPSYASFLVNFGYFPRGATLLDPFCGSGGILIEAGLKGYSVRGIDILPQMTMGASVNLKFYGIRNFSIEKGDFLEYDRDEKFDGIVTDFPYGRNSHISTSSNEFYEGSARMMSNLLTTGSRACIVTDTIRNLEYFKKYFTVDKIISQRVHASLTRNFARLIKN